MPEEKKKDSFTFSDKIRDSKKVGPKSFVNRLSSKIGSDGKPRQTLFERTKRDAPFFIAAIVALLLLPFLYKYSGQVSEEPALVTPGYEDAIINPDRSGFDFSADPEGQISQLAGRDSMDLIVGFGKRGEEESDETLEGDIYRSGLSDSAYSKTDNDEEVNNTNIYKYRKQAAPQTRAAFRRAATKIGRLGKDGLSGRGGGFAVDKWGGSMKAAANKVRTPGPRNSTKPVSLQPLQAAGKPSRSSFGQGAAAEARRSKDAMSKGNAMQALMDAQMKPVEPGKIGGLFGGDYGGPGGGNGNLQRQFAFNGKEPWWWDMMKTRSQMEWERRFNYKWGWIDFGTQLAQKFLDPFLSCLLTGTDDWSMGHMFGTVKGAGSEPECCGMNEKKFKGAAPGVAFEKDACKGWVKAHPEVKCATKWDDGHKSSANLGFLGARWDCLTNGAGFNSNWRKRDRGYLDGASCESFAMNGQYHANFSSMKGKEDKWSLFHMVVGVENDMGLEDYYKGVPYDQQKQLKILYMGRGDHFNAYAEKATDIKGIPLFIETVAIRDLWFRTGGKQGTGLSKEAYDKTARREFDSDSQNSTLPKGLEENPIKVGETYASVVDKLRRGGLITTMDGKDGETYRQVGRRLIGKNKVGKDFVIGSRCEYPLARISCEDFANALGTEGRLLGIGTNGETTKGDFPYAHLKFFGQMRGAIAYQEMKNRFAIYYHVHGQDNDVAHAGTTSTGADKGQVYVVPHYDIKPFEKTTDKNVRVEASTTVHENEIWRPGDELQVLARHTLKKLSEGRGRVFITWEIRQCPDLETDGSSIKNGGCHEGILTTVDDKGAQTGILGQDIPGKVVSTATCVYGDGQVIQGFTDESGEQDKVTETVPNPNTPGPNPNTPGPNPNTPGPDPNTPGPNPNTPGPGPKIRLSQRINKIDEKYDERPGINRKSFVTKVNTCGLGDATKRNKLTKDPIESLTVYDQRRVKEYVDQVVRDANEILKEQNVELLTEDQISVANLVDALTIDEAVHSHAQVPINVVCALGKTIGLHAPDPHTVNSNKVSPNQFGAFAAYIDEDSSFFPSKRNQNKTLDRRFYGCLKGQEKQPVTKDFHWGEYNWNYHALGDSQGSGKRTFTECKKKGETKTLGAVGPEGRTPYIKVLNGAGETSYDRGRVWTVNKHFPLAAIGKAVGFQITDSISCEEAKKYNGSIDDYNRQQYYKVYGNIFNKTDSCNLDGDMSVSDALDYIDLLCKNTVRAKPSNGTPFSCGTDYAESTVPGADDELPD